MKPIIFLLPYVMAGASALAFYSGATSSAIYLGLIAIIFAIQFK